MNKLPEAWREVELGDVLDYEQPTKYIVNLVDYDDNYSTPVLTAGKSFILGYTDESEGIYAKLPVIIFDDFTTDNKFVNFKFKVKSSAMKLLRPKNNSVDLKYVFLFMQTIKHSSTTHKRYYLSSYQHTKIPLPPLPIQKKIVEKLEKAEKLKQYREEADKLTNDYLQCVFYEMFMKGVVKEKIRALSEICEINPKKTEIKDTDKNQSVNFLGMEDVGENGELYELNTRKLKEVIKGYTYFKKGDVLFAKITPCMENGKGAIAKIKTEIGFGSTEFHVFRPNKNINSEFIYYLLSLETIRKNAKSNMTGSAGQKRVPVAFFDILKIQLPLIELQSKFASIVKQVESMKEQQKQSKEQIDNLFNALMQKAFTGELVV